MAEALPDNQSQQSQKVDLDESYLEGCASLVDLIDKKVLVVLRDERNVIGMLRSSDQFNNLVLSESIERVHLNKEYSEVPLGIFVVRGDNILLLGEVDAEKEVQARSTLKQIPSHIMLVKKREHDELTKIKEAKKCAAAKLRDGSYRRSGGGAVDY